MSTTFKKPGAKTAIIVTVSVLVLAAVAVVIFIVVSNQAKKLSAPSIPIPTPGTTGLNPYDTSSIPAVASGNNSTFLGDTTPEAYTPLYKTDALAPAAQTTGYLQPVDNHDWDPDTNGGFALLNAPLPTGLGIMNQPDTIPLKWDPSKTLPTYNPNGRPAGSLAATFGPSPLEVNAALPTFQEMFNAKVQGPKYVRKANITSYGLVDPTTNRVLVVPPGYTDNATVHRPNAPHLTQANFADALARQRRIFAEDCQVAGC